MSMDTFELKPAYDFPTDGSSVVLHEGTVQMCVNGTIHTGAGKISLDFGPRARICCHCHFDGLDAGGDAAKVHNRQATLSSFALDERKLESFLLCHTLLDETIQTYLKWSLPYEPFHWTGDETTQMNRIVFHVLNFVPVIGNRRTFGKRLIEHVDLKHGKWKVELRSLPDTQETIRSLEAEGGYRLTHIGSVQKTDGTPFSGKDAGECLDALRLFLSFAKGGWCEPICAVGFDEADTRVWEEFTSPSESWQVYHTWFEPRDNSELPALFPGFMTKWDNQDWRTAMSNAIKWYLKANYSTREADSGIILTQTALEDLYAKCVASELTSEPSQRIARYKLSAMFKALKIPDVIPDETAHLQACANTCNWESAAHAFTAVRNDLAHASPKIPTDLKTSQYYLQAWNLGQWLLEMCILRLCDYHGTYANRLHINRWRGTTETVPWDASSI